MLEGREGRRSVKVPAKIGRPLFTSGAKVADISFSKCSGQKLAPDATGIYAASMPRYAFLQHRVGELLFVERNIKKI